jgi:putative membrane protein
LLIEAACSTGSTPEASSGPTTLDLSARTMDPNEEEVLEMETTVLAGFGWGGGPWFLFFPLLWIALFVGAFFLFRRRDQWQTHSAEEVVAELYAKGEISADEYRQRLGVLRGREG